MLTRAQFWALEGVPLPATIPLKDRLNLIPNDYICQTVLSEVTTGAKQIHLLHFLLASSRRLCVPFLFYCLVCCYTPTLQSCVRLFATPWTVARLLCPWDFPSKNTRVDCHLIEEFFFFFNFKKYLSLAVLGLSCIMWDLSLWPMDSLVAARAAQCARAQSPHGVWDLSSRARDQTHVCFIGRWNLNHWTTREIPLLCFYRQKLPSYQWPGLEWLKPIYQNQKKTTLS